MDTVRIQKEMTRFKYGRYAVRSISFLLLICLCLLPVCHSSRAQEETILLDLEQAYRLAMRQHERIMIANEEVWKTRLLPQKANTLLLPTVSVNGAYVRLQEQLMWEDVITTVPKSRWKGSLEVTQPLYDGSFFPTRQQALVAIDNKIADCRMITQEILFQVAEAYYEILKAKELFENAEEILRLSEEGLSVSRVQWRVGQVTEDVVLRSELSVSSASSELIQKRNDLTLAKDFLKRFIGDEVGEYDIAHLPPLLGISETYDVLVEKALEQRSDYKSLLLKVKLAEIDTDIVKTKFHPRVEGAWNYYQIDDPAFNEDDDFWAAVLQIRMPIFEANSRFIELKEKHSRVRQSKLALKDLEKTIRIEVERAMLAVQTHESILGSLKKQLELAQKNYDIVFTKFKFGSAMSLDLDQALTTLHSAKTDLTTTTYDCQVAILNLERTIGLFAANFVNKEWE